jgi:hypothetical protein
MAGQSNHSNPTTIQPQTPSDEPSLTDAERLRRFLACLEESVNSLLQASQRADTVACGQVVRDRYLALRRVGTDLRLPPPPCDLSPSLPERPEWLAWRSGSIDLARRHIARWDEWRFRVRLWHVDAESQLRARDAEGRHCRQPTTRKGRPRKEQGAGASIPTPGPRQGGNRIAQAGDADRQGTAEGQSALEIHPGSALTGQGQATGWTLRSADARTAHAPCAD